MIVFIMQLEEELPKESLEQFYTSVVIAKVLSPEVASTNLIKCNN
jgi:hypothetical protein